MSTLAIEHIVSTPDKMSGRPRIAGTRVRVQDIVVWHDAGISVEEMPEQFGVTLAQVYAALSYYYDHRDEIERNIREDTELAEKMSTPLSELRAEIEARREAGPKPADNA
jgi:uncharacterized protein (DUF433 family)